MPTQTAALITDEPNKVNGCSDITVRFHKDGSVWIDQHDETVILSMHQLGELFDWAGANQPRGE